MTGIQYTIIILILAVLILIVIIVGRPPFIILLHQVSYFLYHFFPLHLIVSPVHHVFVNVIIDHVYRLQSLILSFILLIVYIFPLLLILKLFYLLHLKQQILLLFFLKIKIKIIKIIYIFFLL